jgi:hypothetical protein
MCSTFVYINVQTDLFTSEKIVCSDKYQYKQCNLIKLQTIIKMISTEVNITYQFSRWFVELKWSPLWFKDKRIKNFHLLTYFHTKTKAITSADLIMWMIYKPCKIHLQRRRLRKPELMLL